MNQNEVITMQLERAAPIPDLKQWRARLLSWIMRGIFFAAMVVGIPNVILSLARGQLVLAATHALALIWFTYLYLHRSSHPQRVTQLLLAGLYGFGVVALISQSYLALIYLIIMPTAAAMLVSRRATVFWLASIAAPGFLCG